MVDYKEGTGMYCINCGKELREDAAFCVICGAKVIENNLIQNKDKISVDLLQNTTPGPVLTEKNGKRKGRAFWLIVVVIVLMGIGAAFLYINTKDDEENFVENELKLPENEVEYESFPVIEEQITEDGQEDEESLVTEESEDVYSLFKITRETVENYTSALDTNDYQYYNSGIENFRFFYPAVLYSDVLYNEQEAETPYGINIKTISFVGSAGSELFFSLSRYADGVSIEEISEKIYNTEKSVLIDAADVVYGIYEDHGRIIVTGNDRKDLKPVYNLFYVDSEYVMQMKIIFPVYQGIEDKLQKAYVTECMYRLCGFSGSTANCRSYETFKAESMDLEVELAQIEERYYAVQERLNNMEIVSGEDVTVFIEDGNICNIVIDKGTGGIDYVREYSFGNGRLYFAFVYDEGSEHRFYFVDDMLVRYINEGSEIYDLEAADAYMEFASKYQSEAYEYQNVYLDEKKKL